MEWAWILRVVVVISFDASKESDNHEDSHRMTGECVNIASSFNHSYHTSTPLSLLRRTINRLAHVLGDVRLASRGDAITKIPEFDNAVVRSCWSTSAGHTVS